MLLANTLNHTRVAELVVVLIFGGGELKQGRTQSRQLASHIRRDLSTTHSLASLGAYDGAVQVEQRELGRWFGVFERAMETALFRSDERVPRELEGRVFVFEVGLPSQVEYGCDLCLLLWLCR